MQSFTAEIGRSWRKILLRSFITWLPLAIASGGIVGINYISLQQSYRSAANDPQLSISQNIVQGIKDGKSPADLVGTQVVDLTASTLPCTIIYDSNFMPQISSCLISNKIPIPPQGVLESSLKGVNIVTWAPSSNIRLATVVRPYYFNGHFGYVLVCRSLSDTESRIDKLGIMDFFLLLALILFIFLACSVSEFASLGDAAPANKNESASEQDQEDNSPSDGK